VSGHTTPERIRCEFRPPNPRCDGNGETDLYVVGDVSNMSGKAKLVLVIALVAIVYFVVSSGGDSVEVTAE
jgi:hypothetical protein